VETTFFRTEVQKQTKMKKKCITMGQDVSDSWWFVHVPKSGLTGSTGTDTESLARLDKNFVKACSFLFTTVSSQVTATRSEDCLRTKLAMSC